MTQEEFIRFKELLGRLTNFTTMDGDGKFGLEFTGGVDAYGNSHEVKIKNFILGEEYLEKEIGYVGIGAGKYTVGKLIKNVLEARDYKKLHEDLKESYSDITYGIQMLINDISNYTKVYNAQNNLDLEDLYEVDEYDKNTKEAVLDTETDIEKLKKMKDQLNASRTITNSTEYKNIISKIDETIKKLGQVNVNDKDGLNKYADIMDDLSNVTQKYVDHKMKDGTKDNAVPKFAAALEVLSFANHKSVLSYEKVINKNKDEVLDGNADKMKINKENLKRTAERLAKIYPDKADEITKILSIDGNVIQYENTSVCGAFDAVDYLSTETNTSKEDIELNVSIAIATNMVMSELIYSGGKRSPYLDAIFGGNDVTKKFFNQAESIKRSAKAKENYITGNEMKSYSENKEIYDELFIDPIKSADRAKNDSDTLKSLYLNNAEMRFMPCFIATKKEEARKEAEAEAAKEKANLETLKKEEAAEARKKAYKQNVRNAAVYRYIASHTKDENVRNEFTEKANKASEKALFGEIAEKKSTAVNKDKSAEKNNSGLNKK